MGHVPIIFFSTFFFYFLIQQNIESSSSNLAAGALESAISPRSPGFFSGKQSLKAKIQTSGVLATVEVSLIPNPLERAWEYLALLCVCVCVCVCVCMLHKLIPPALFLCCSVSLVSEGDVSGS